MSKNPHVDAMTPLPRASLLTYLHPPRRYRATAWRKAKQNHTPLLPRITEDEEAAVRNERDNTGEQDDEQDSSWGLYEILCMVCYALLVFILVLNVDVLLSRWDMGMGILEWKKAGVEGIGQQMHFCLETQNRVAPGPRVWRYMTPYPTESCGTKILTLTAGTTEAWKLLSEDQVHFEDDVKASRYHAMGKSLDWTEQAQRIEELGDDLAEEGRLTQITGGSSRSGFGGRWARRS
ncbi:hypothetical protein BDV95DRAFT_597433 [Massariosphaeria phaeospora]|uniref:Uncharacterized protein n=1 Tax=Massariosphaeria phaeospora TaxID=100035 RepID=A0A7C8MFF9_9PLEO|nr:hypothetical protein BDV95DRAFT_597433 [Massariosphaeria phaeospora]